MGRLVRIRALVAVLALGSLGGCQWLLEEPGSSADRPRAARVSLFRHPWTWTDEQGTSVRFGRWRGQPVVVSAIYTSCKTTCTRTVQKLRELHAAFRREGRAPQFLLVTLDPENDTPARLRSFKQSERLPASWHLLAGSVTQTRKLTQLLDMHVMDADSHLMHDGNIVVFDARGMPIRSFTGWDLDGEAPPL